MRTISYQSKNFKTAIRSFSRRAEPADDLCELVAEILETVRKGGDKALVDYSARFDKVALKPADFSVTEKEFEGASESVSSQAIRAIAASYKNVAKFAKKGLRKDWKTKNAQGAEVGEIFRPFQRVGIYVPGGSAPLVSTALMTVTLAASAGVPEIVVCTPCGESGQINPALLYALGVAGATEVYRIGGAQAIAAMAYGTKKIRPVAKIFGPGNRFVVEAKRQLVGTVSIDLLPGPSEILILSDSSGKAGWIAADLLAQAEHGGDSQVGLITDSEKLLLEVKEKVISQAKSLSRQSAVNEVLKKGCTLVLVENLEEGVELVNDFAPEHLSLITRREEKIMPLIRTAGAIFLGNYSPVAVGDFLAGPSHTLPTGGAGKSFPGLTVDQFQLRTSVIRLDEASAAESAPIVEAFAEMEGLDAHGRSVTVRGE